MVHYATDVLGGLLVGVIAAVLGYLLMKLVMKIKGLEKVDAAKLFKKVPGKVGFACIGVAVLGIFLYCHIFLYFHPISAYYSITRRKALYYLYLK
jgi:H+/Cl- antiporter ClcA